MASVPHSVSARARATRVSGTGPTYWPTRSKRWWLPFTSTGAYPRRVASARSSSREDRDPAWREHVTPFLYRHPERFNLKRVANDVDLSVHRWCVDVPEDLELVRHVYDELGDRPFGWREVLAVCDTHPEWSTINRQVVQKRFAS